MLERNWKHQCLPPCFARLARKSSMERPAARLISRLNLCVFWKLVNLQGCVWETTKISWGPYCRKRWQITAAWQFGLQIYSNVATMKIHAAKAAVVQEMWEIGKDSGVGPDESQKKSEVINEARVKGIKVHFASLMDICHLKNAELETRHQ